MLVSQDASGGATLVVEKTQMTDAGTYTAVGTNDVGQAETSCEVKVRTLHCTYIPCFLPGFLQFKFTAKAVIFPFIHFH